MDPNIMAAFRHAYGRLCRMSAEALDHGYHRQAVWLASTGESTAQSRTLRAIQRQQAVLSTVMEGAAQLGFPPASFVKDAMDVKAIIEGEWDVELPVESESESVT